MSDGSMTAEPEGSFSSISWPTVHHTLYIRVLQSSCGCGSDADAEENETAADVVSKTTGLK